MAITRCNLITFLALAISLLLQTTLAAAAPAPAYSSKISAFPLASLQGSASAADGSAEAKRRNLKGGGGRGIGGRGFRSRGNRYRGGGTRGIGYHARSAAVSLDHSLGIIIPAVTVSSLIIVVFLV